MLAEMPDDPSLCRNEQRNAVRRRLHDRSQDETVLRLRPHAAGDRTLARDGKYGAARTHGDAAGTHDGSRIAADREIAKAGLIKTRLTGVCEIGRAHV